MRKLRPALLLLGVAVLGYGVLIPQLGFYWDELPMSWIRYELGPAAMARYFSTNRPVWGLLYQLTTRLLPQVPIYWQIFALLWRWLSAVLVWLIAREVRPARGSFAIGVSLLFLLYPGFNQQWTAYLYSHFFIVLCFLLCSFYCTLRALQQRFNSKGYWRWTAAGMMLSALNLWMMEYFFVLELLRPFLVLHRLSVGEDQAPLWPRVRRTVLLWAPYLGVFVANVVWRLFVFNNQVYKPILLSDLRSAPLAAFWELATTVAADLYEVSVGAWLQVLHFPSISLDGPRTTIFYVGVVLCTVLLIWLIAYRRAPHAEMGRPDSWPIGLGLIGMLFAGGPFWLTGLEVSLAHPANRFTLPFMLGVSLLLGGLADLLPARVRIVLLVLLLALAAGRQALWADAYRRDWTTQKNLFWQMVWRAPGIRPGTMVLLNEGPLQFYADNSLTGALNWIYDPANRSSSMDYVLFYPTSRFGGTLQELSAGQSVSYDFISEVFTGSTSQTLAFDYSPPGCLRLLDPGMDPENRLIADDSMMREAARLSSSQWILTDPSASMPAIYGPEPAHGWCYYFERAELEAQRGDWSRVTELADQAFRLTDHPNDPVERFVFIEAYASTGNWTRAEELAVESYMVSPKVVGPLLCTLIDRMDRGANAVDQGLDESRLNDLRTKFSCLP